MIASQVNWWTGWVIAATEPAIRQRTDIHWSTPWPIWTLLLAGVAAVACVATLYARDAAIARGWRRGLALLRLSALATVLLMLAPPTIQRSRLVPPTLALVIDVSGSMSTTDAIPHAGSRASEQPIADADPTRVARSAAVQRLLDPKQTSLLQQLAEDFDLRIVLTASDVKGVAGDEISTLNEVLEAANEASVAEGAKGVTRLGDAVDVTVHPSTGPRPTGVILVSDGQSTVGQSLDQAAVGAKLAGVPIFALGVGSLHGGPDAAISDVAVESVVFPGDRLPIEVTVHSADLGGTVGGLRLENVETGETLQDTEVALSDQPSAQSVQLAIRPEQAGTLPLRLTLNGTHNDMDLRNNACSLTVDVQAQSIRVLLVESAPSFEFRALKSMLERDPAIELSAHLQQADVDIVDIDPRMVTGAPLTPEQWQEYDVAIVGQIGLRLLPSSWWPNVLAWVSDHGGGLALYSSLDRNSQLSAGDRAYKVLLPIEPPHAASPSADDDELALAQVQPATAAREQSSLQLSDDHERSQRIWNTLPAVFGRARPTRPKPGAQVLAVMNDDADGSDSSRPAIVRHYVGAGEVLLHATDETWKWRWRSDDRYFARYWGQTVRRLARGKFRRRNTVVTTDQAEYEVGEPVQIRAVAGRGRLPSNDELTVELTATRTRDRRVTLHRRQGSAGMYEATLFDLSSDHYAARALSTEADSASPPAEFDVLAPLGEMQRSALDWNALQSAADISSGAARMLHEADELLQELPEPTAVELEKMPLESLISRHLLLLLLCTTLGIEWLLRRRLGML